MTPDEPQSLEYLSRIPETTPDGFFLVHNSGRSGTDNFKAWLVASLPDLPGCSCHRAPGSHFKHPSTTE
jgi:hypothetical protein